MEQTCCSQLSDRTSVLASSQFSVLCQPIFQDGLSCETPATVPYTPLHKKRTRNLCGLVTFLHLSHPSAQQTLHQLVRVLHKPFGLGVRTWPARHDRFLSHASKHLMMIWTGSSVSPFSVTAAASVARDSSSRSVTTTMSSPEKRVVQPSPPYHDLSFLSLPVIFLASTTSHA